MSGTRPSSSWRTRRMASMTYCRSAAASMPCTPSRSRGAADGLLDHRPVLGREVEADAHGLERQQDVGEDDGGVEIEAAQRLQRDLGGDVGAHAHLDERELLADGAVLGQVAARLAHEPHGRRVDGDAGTGIEKAHGHPLVVGVGRVVGRVIVANGSPWAPVDGEKLGRRRLTPPACTPRRAPPSDRCDRR